jgi:pyruvate dehydrogenase E2 component (dihydrolipoamide acetyltransferase)
VVETDKAELEVEVWEDGVLIETLVPLGQKVPVGTPLARLGDLVGAGGGPATITEPAPSGSDVPPGAAPAPMVVPEEAARPSAPEELRGPAAAPLVVPEEPATAERPAPAPVPVGAGADVDGARPAVHGPLARHRAEELGVDLAGVTGTGPGGSITRRDVEEAAASRPAAVEEGRARVSPYARRLAAERGIDATALTGSGPGGAVVARDLEGAEPPRAETPRPSEAAPATPSERGGVDTMRLAIARAMDRANREIPHYHLGLHADLTTARDWLEARNAERPAAERILPAALQLKAVALALRSTRSSTASGSTTRSGRPTPSTSVSPSRCAAEG